MGTGYHGTFAFIGDTVQCGDASLLSKMVGYWTIWGFALVVGYAVLCLCLIALILTRRTRYPLWALFVTPPFFLLLGAVAIWLLPPELSGINTFIAVTGLNLPLLVFYGVTWKLLSAAPEPTEALTGSEPPH